VVWDRRDDPRKLVEKIAELPSQASALSLQFRAERLVEAVGEVGGRDAERELHEGLRSQLLLELFHEPRIDLDVLVASLAHPGGNITGVTPEASLDIAVKRLGLLKEVAPKTLRVGILANPSNPVEARGLDAMASAAQGLRLTLLPVEVRSLSDLDGAFAVLSRERADALTAFENPLNWEHRGLIVSFAARNRPPGGVR
jgi:ABC transporter substrate binding protein